MSFLLNIPASLCLLLFQTTVVVHFGFFEHYFDVVIVYIIFLGFYRSFIESLCFTLLLGLFMDSLAGGSFGVYLTTYFWLFLMAERIKRFLHAGSLLLMPLIIVSGVVFENMVFCIPLLFSSRLPYTFSGFIGSLSTQIIWAFFTGPVVFYLIRHSYVQLDRWGYRMTGARNKTTP